MTATLTRPLEAILNDCGTGAGGFKPGNTCAKGDGGGVAGAFSSMPVGKATSKEAKAWRKKMQKQYDEDPEFRAVVDSVTLYTQGDFSVQRAFAERAITGELAERWHDSALPEWVDKGMHPNPLGTYKSYFEGQEEWLGEEREGTSGATYSEAAKELVNAVADSPPLATSSYRGMTGRTAVDLAAALKPGDDFQLLAPTSFTTDKDVGEQFAAGRAKGQARARKDDKPHGVVFEILPGARSLNVSALSPWDQKEVLTSGKFRVISVDIPKDRFGNPTGIARVVLEQVEVFRAKE